MDVFLAVFELWRTGRNFDIGRLFVLTGGAGIFPFYLIWCHYATVKLVMLPGFDALAPTYGEGRMRTKSLQVYSETVIRGMLKSSACPLTTNGTT